MSDFLEHKKSIDPAAWVARIPEKWRMPAMLGGPALLIILMTPLLFRDERAKPIDRNQVDSLAKTARQESTAHAQKEAALDEALARKLSAETPSYGPGAPAAAAPAAAPKETAPAEAASVVAAPQPDNGPAGTSGATTQGSDDQPHLQAANMNAPSGSSGGGAAGAGPAAAPARAAGLGSPMAVNKPMPTAKLRPFNWSGPGKGAGGQLGNAVPQFGATVNTAAAGNGSSTPGSSAFTSGASAYSHGGAGGGGGSQQSHAPGGSSASANPTEGGGGGAGAAGGSGANMGALQAQMQKCQDAQHKYQPDIDSNQKAMQADIKFRSDHDCRNIPCYECSYQLTHDGHWASWYRNYYCPCAHAHCDASARCNSVKSDMALEAKACPAGFSTGDSNMDCSMSGSH